MVIVTIKPFDEILQSIGSSINILTVGCAGCSAVCCGGGQREVENFNDALGKHHRAENMDVKLNGLTVERQCDPKFLSLCDKSACNADVILSMGCGAGTQLLADRYHPVSVYPIVNTVSIGISQGPGLYEERCRACGDCQLGYTSGICPVTSCAKSLLNGPCGGPKNGDCEVGHNLQCAWCHIYERLKQKSQLDNIMNIKPAMNWQSGIKNTVIQPEFQSLYPGLTGKS